MRHSLLAAATVLFVLHACAGSEEAPEMPIDPVSGLPLVTLSGDIQQIGVVEGSTDYQFFRVTGAIRLASGNIVVANTGTSELRYYDRDGSYLHRGGGSGRGPGEFQSLKGVFERGPDTILAYDEVGRVSLFDHEGQFLESTNVTLSQNRFPMDVWLYRHNWIEGVPDLPGVRSSVAINVSHLPQPPSDPGYRFMRVDQAGNLWVAERYPEGGPPDRMIVHTAQGEPYVVVQLPERFRITSITMNEVIGVWQNEDDVELLRIYPLTLPPTPAPAEPNVVSDTAGTSDWDSGQLQAVRMQAASVLRNMVTAQERYFAQNLTYTDDVTQLELDLPEGLRIYLLEVSGRGWLAILIADGAPGICGIGLGYHTPAGWLEGVPTCAQLNAEP